MARTTSVVPSAVGLGLYPLPEAGAKSSMIFLSVTLLNGRVCAKDFAVKAFEYGNAFDTVGQRKRFIVLHPRSSLSLRRKMAPPRNVEIENCGKIRGFSSLKSDTN